MPLKIDPNQHLEKTEILSSRYRLTGLTVDDSVRLGTKRYKTWTRPEINMETYIRYTVTAKDIGRLDLIAYTYLGSASLWWVVADLNNINNQLEDMGVGQTLFIPPIEEVMKALNIV